MSRIRHIAITTKDVARLVKFYTTAAEREPTFQTVTSIWRFCHWSLSARPRGRISRKVFIILASR